MSPQPRNPLEPGPAAALRRYRWLLSVGGLIIGSRWSWDGYLPWPEWLVPVGHAALVESCPAAELERLAA